MAATPTHTCRATKKHSHWLIRSFRHVRFRCGGFLARSHRPKVSLKTSERVSTSCLCSLESVIILVGGAILIFTILYSHFYGFFNLAVAILSQLRSDFLRSSKCPTLRSRGKLNFLWLLPALDQTMSTRTTMVLMRKS